MAALPSLSRTSNRWRWLLLLALVVAVVLRFAGLSWGLRHTPIRDEQDFVENVAEMISHKDLNPRFYEYPGLFFYLLRPVLSVTPPSAPYVSTWDGFPRRTLVGPSGYWAARAVVAAFGAASVLLVALLGKRLLSSSAGVVAALLLAVSPIEVFVAHEVRPDVVLETFVLLALLAFDGLGEDLSRDALSGAALGAAAAVKFTGGLLLPTYLFARWTTPGMRWRGTVVAGVAAALVWILFTPYALLDWPEFLQGAAFQVSFHYRLGGFATAFGSRASYYLRTITWSLGPIGAVLALVGVWVALRWGHKRWLCILAYPAVLLVVLSTAGVHWQRLMLSSLGVAALVAALGFDAVARRFPRIAWAAVSLAVVVQLALSAEYLSSVVHPGARDLVLAWTDAHVPRGARILNTVHELGLDRGRVEVVEETGDPRLDRALALQSDYVIWHPPSRAALAGLIPIARFEPSRPRGALGADLETSLDSLGRPLLVYAPPASMRPQYRRIDLDAAEVRASSDPEHSRLALDGDLDTEWSTQGAQGRDSFSILLPKTVRLGRVTLALGRWPNRYGRDLRLLLTVNGIDWRPTRWASGRSPVDEQIALDPATASQVLIVDPVDVRGIQIRQVGVDSRRWGIAELSLDSLDSSP